VGAGDGGRYLVCSFEGMWLVWDDVMVGLCVYTVLFNSVWFILKFTIEFIIEFVLNS
jgi:hypothetical protein